LRIFIILAKELRDRRSGRETDARLSWIRTWRQGQHKLVHDFVSILTPVLFLTLYPLAFLSFLSEYERREERASQTATEQRVQLQAQILQQKIVLKVYFTNSRTMKIKL
jgi:hypothetical protein